MEKLLESLTRLANAAADYYENQAHPLSSLSAVPGQDLRVGPPAAATDADKDHKAHLAEFVLTHGTPPAPPTPEQVKAHFDEHLRIASSRDLKKAAEDHQKHVDLATAYAREEAEKAESAARVSAPAPAAATKPGIPEPAEKRGRGRPKKSLPVPAGEPAGLPVDAEFAALSPEESEKLIYAKGEEMMDAYPTDGANGPDGSPAPEGYHICAGIMKDRFGVERLSKMNHAQRLQFMTILKGYLQKAPLAVAANGATENDPNLGV